MTMTDQTESEYAELLTTLSFHSSTYARDAFDAIRALEAKVREAEEAAGIAKAFHDVAVAERNYERIKCDRLAGEVERLTLDLANARKEYELDRPWATEVARLTSELAAARENEARWSRDVADAYGWLWCVNEEPGTPNRFPAERAAYNARMMLRDLLTNEQRGIGINRAVIQRDAARRAGGGG